MMFSKSFVVLVALSTGETHSKDHMGHTTQLTSFSITAAIAQDTSGLTFSSLYIPGFDPQPINVQPIGVGSDGRTTYVLGPGVATNTDDTPLPATGMSLLLNEISFRN